MKTRNQWVAMLAKLVAPMEPVKAAKALADMLPMLTDFPDQAFTIDSLDAVATNCGAFVPSYSELRSYLGIWWKAHRPQPIAIAGDQPSTIRQREIEREVRDSWSGITPEQVRAKIRALDGHHMRNLLGGFLASALTKYAPEHLGLLPPEWLSDRTESADIVALRQPKQRPNVVLSPEQLTAARADLQAKRAAALSIPSQVRRGDA